MGLESLESYVSIDLEFSWGGDEKNLPKEKRQSSIIEIGAVKVTGKEQIQKFWKVRLLPGRQFQEYIIKEFGKNPSDYQDATPPGTALTELIEFVGDLPVLGQDFENKDLWKINEHLNTLDMDEWEPASIQDLRDWSGGKGLPKVADQLGLEYGNNHDALEDAWVTMQAYEHYKEEREKV